DPGRFRSIATLNDVTVDMIRDLRVLARGEMESDAETYLRLHIHHPGYRAYWREFIRDVVHDGADPATWGTQDVLVAVRADPRAPLAIGVDRVKAELAGMPGERWWCLSVADAVEVNRRGEDEWWGAPGVLVRGVPYWWQTGRPWAMALTVAGALVGHAVGPVRAVPEHRFDVALRRWIALRASWWARRGGALAAADVDQLAAAIGVARSPVSRDATLALAALLREARAPFDPRTQVRGFVGPDRWYRGWE